MLALDIGTRRIGVAVSDELRVSVSPLGSVPVVGPKSDAHAVRALIAGRPIERLVIGLPLLESGDEGASAARTRAAGDDLARRLQLPHEYVDESGTTLEAHAVLRERRWRGDADGDVDAIAAALILEAWLASPGSGA